MRPVDVQTVDEANVQINRLAKWRTHFAGWLLGTRTKTDPQSQWARDNTEKLLILRAECSALTRILIDKGIVTGAEYTIQLGQEAVALQNMLEERWPGISAGDDGLHYDVEAIRKAGTMSGWLP